MERKEYCNYCDGCGWYEGGKYLQTTCEYCNGTGVKPNHKHLTDVKGMTRKDIVPFYKSLIASNPSDAEVIRVNNLILSKWKPRGLEYIKDRAWKR